MLTNEAGDYAFPSLPPGIYTVRAERAGFKTLVRTHVEIQVQQNARIDFELQVGQVSESVEVVASALMVTENATVGTVIENKRIVDLPLNGRNYLQLVSLAPNVSTGFSTQGQAGARQGGIRAAQTISVAGQRTNFNHYTLDGVENTDPNFNTFVVMPSVDALAGIQGADGHLSGGVRTRDHADQRLDQVRHKPISRLRFRVSAQRQTGRHGLCVYRPAAGQRPVQMEPVWLHARLVRRGCRRSSTARTSCSSWPTTSRSASGAVRRACSHSPRRPFKPEISPRFRNRFSIRSAARGRPTAV